MADRDDSCMLAEMSVGDLNGLRYHLVKNVMEAEEGLLKNAADLDYNTGRLEQVVRELKRRDISGKAGFSSCAKHRENSGEES